MDATNTQPSATRAFGPRSCAAVVAAVSLASLLLQYALLLDGTRTTVGPWLATLRFFSYFTVLANVLVVAVTVSAALVSTSPLGRWLARPRVRGGAALYIAVTGTVYVLVLRHLWQPQGAQWWVDTGLHYATPLLYPAWWLFAVAHGRLGWRDVAAWLWFPLGYVGWALLRGQWRGEYPYPFLDAGVLGPAALLRNAVAMFGLFLVVGALLVLVDRLLDRVLSRPYER